MHGSRMSTTNASTAAVVFAESSQSNPVLNLVLRCRMPFACSPADNR
jgi:hypothetical protein